MLSLFCPLVKRLEYLKIVTSCETSQQGRELLYCFQLVYGTREFVNISSARSRSDFIIQNYSMKTQGKIFTICIKITRKIKNRV
jgi:hypothetical protein